MAAVLRGRLLVLGLLSLCPTLDASASPHVCGVSVRVLAGTGRAEGSTSKPLQAGNEISDLAEQLAPLPFSQFEVVDQGKASLACGREKVFTLAGPNHEQHSLRVKVENIVHDGAMILVGWQDADEHELLSSKVHLVNNRNWVFGSDTSADSSTIVSIRVNCGESHD